MSNHLSCYIE